MPLFVVILNVILLFVNGAIKIMIYHLTTPSITDLYMRITSLFTSVVHELETFLFAADKVHILSLTMAAVVLVSLFFGIIFVTTKILFSFSKKDSSSQDDIENREDPEDTALESELEEQLSPAPTAYSAVEESESHNNVSATKNDEPFSYDEPTEYTRSSDQNSYDEDYKDFSHKKKEDFTIPLDWQKKPSDKKNIENQRSITPSTINVRKNLQDLLGMIVNMLGRHVDELKIAQAVMYRCRDNVSEETILQIVQAAKEFILLCQQGAFDNVRRIKDLPSDEDCVLHLIAGDASHAMALMEALMDEKINQAVNMKNMVQRNALFKQASNYACYFGTMAEIHDQNLASASFELAIEMYPDNTLAWSRCADLYNKQGFKDKANWAYRNVLKIAHKDIDASQEANARKYLSQYLYDMGENIQASELYLKSKSYYDSIGINRPLDRKELEIISLMDKTTTDRIVHSVLPQKQNYL